MFLFLLLGAFILVTLFVSKKKSTNCFSLKKSVVNEELCAVEKTRGCCKHSVANIFLLYISTSMFG